MDKKLNCVLLIDDDEGNCFLCRLVIERYGIANTIAIALNGKEAIDYLTNSGKFQMEIGCPNPEPELVFLDINMPIMDGWEFIDAYRNLAINKPSIIIMLSGTFNPDDEKMAATIPEISQFQNKPLTNAVLDTICKKYFPEYL